MTDDIYKEINDLYLKLLEAASHCIANELYMNQLDEHNRRLEGSEAHDGYFENLLEAAENLLEACT